jgi:hypothetical protein
VLTRLLLKLLPRLGASAALLYFVLRSIDLAAPWDRVRAMHRVDRARTDRVRRKWIRES